MAKRGGPSRWLLDFPLHLAFVLELIFFASFSTFFLSTAELVASVLCSCGSSCSNSSEFFTVSSSDSSFLLGPSSTSSSLESASILKFTHGSVSGIVVVVVVVGIIVVVVVV